MIVTPTPPSTILGSDALFLRVDMHMVEKSYYRMPTLHMEILKIHEFPIITNHQFAFTFSHSISLSCPISNL